jgi:hypothetical protein
MRAVNGTNDAGSTARGGGFKEDKMSERKFKKDVSEIRYSYEIDEELVCYVQAFKSEQEDIQIPVRIVREKFYRKLIQIYEQWKES